MSPSLPDQEPQSLNGWNSRHGSNFIDRLHAPQNDNTQQFRVAEDAYQQMTSRQRQPESSTSTIRAQVASTIGPDSNGPDSTASDLEEDSASSTPALSEDTTSNGSDDSAETRDLPVPPRFNPLFDQHTEEVPEGFDTKTRPCLFWMKGCTNRSSCPQDWSACSRNHMLAKGVDPPTKAICKACPDVKFKDADKWYSWQLSLEHMWEHHVGHGEFKTLFGDSNTDAAFIRWLLSKGFISTADYQSLLQNPFSTEMKPVTETARFAERKILAGGRRARK